ncbi:hypothetical protein CQW32_04815 [Pseudomonas putida]|jgi:hypothetical protein|uniref:hypothetical protein n=1 Tax=Pseudomonas TaxID=286 RepID=UPI000C2AF95B|nr:MULTISPECIES: hypothetical protein [Pseudomonas]PJX11543.1 hypothetical protein CQW32_04815 [Pseudomonas putida]
MTDKGIEVFQNLHLRGSSAAFIRDCVLSQVQEPWHHDAEREEDIGRNAPGDEDVIVLVRASFGNIDESGLLLWQESDGYRVANIVPRNVGELGITKYNLILRDFVSRIAEPAAQAGGFKIDLTSSNQTLEDWLETDSAEALRRFSRQANKSTGASHPMDQKRWFTFLISAHRASKRPDSEQVARWLVEVDGWSSEQAQDLAIDYEFALGLLEQYDNSRS